MTVNVNQWWYRHALASIPEASLLPTEKAAKQTGPILGSTPIVAASRFSHGDAVVGALFCQRAIPIDFATRV
jgi:hypothetical protein